MLVAMYPTFGLFLLMLVWLGSGIGISAIIQSKNISTRWSFTVIIGPLAFLILPFLKAKKGNDKYERTEIILRKMYYLSFFKSTKNNSVTIRYFMNCIKKNRGFNIIYAESMLKIWVEDKKNKVWTSITSSVIISFIVLFSNNMLNRIYAEKTKDLEWMQKTGGITSVTTEISVFGFTQVIDFDFFMELNIFAILYCSIIFIVIAGAMHRVGTFRVLALQEAIQIFKNDDQKRSSQRRSE
ncbi:hypothetical protein [Paenibacillus polymyxa]|uniref:hypothetical protein n=1 Tax=Paenibacillus polymyxa TaxID=1406 RepID=UPI002ED52BDC|nr:hypothetical protein [Paenibacillus polymyxa]